MRSPFGVEFSTFRGGVPGLDPSFTEISGEQLVVERVLRRWLTPHNSIPDLPNAGRDVRSYLQMRASATGRARAKRELEAEARQDPGVATCVVTVERIGTGPSAGLRFIGAITTKRGKSFRAVIEATELRTRVEEISELP